MTYRLGVDVGGTFTDVVLYDSGGQRVWLAKTPSTPQDQSDGVIEGIRAVAPPTAAISDAEGFGGHALTARIRLERVEGGG